MGELRYRDKQRLRYFIGFEQTNQQRLVYFGSGKCYLRIEQDEDLGVLGTYRSSTGKPVGQIFGLVNDGLYTEADFEDVTTGKLKPGLPVPKFSDRVYPGDIKYLDLNGDNEITELVYGFGINLSYKNIDFGAFFQGNGRTYRIIGENQKNFLPGSTIGAEGNIFTNASDAWTVDNPSQDVFYPRLHMGYNANNAQVSDWWLKDMSMLRLKNVELGYSQKILSKKLQWSMPVYSFAEQIFCSSPSSTCGTPN